MRIGLGDGYLVTFPPLISIFAESEGYTPADFDKLVDISEESGDRAKIDENMLLEAMPDFIPFLPREGAKSLMSRWADEPKEPFLRLLIHIVGIEYDA